MSLWILLSDGVLGRQVQFVIQAAGSDADRDQPSGQDDDESPPVLKEDPRDFRARLVAAERSQEAEFPRNFLGFS